MSRVGNLVIQLPPDVTVTIGPGAVEFQGPKGRLATPLRPGVTAVLENRTLKFVRRDDSKEQKALHGLCRTLAANAVVGVTSGYQKQLEIFGVGYRAKIEKDKLELSLGYSRPVVYPIPAGIEIVCEKPTLVLVKGIDKQKVGQVAQEIKNFRRPDVYKLKGVRHAGEKLIKKERKAGVAGA
ncbi:MAG: 50S ribosomal protein L6 [Candidatus Aminicenantes bacterium]|nr:50S ribosomal protein L6 [Candidatus Aminicenantes bacterium]